MWKRLRLETRGPNRRPRLARDEPLTRRRKEDKTQPIASRPSHDLALGPVYRCVEIELWVGEGAKPSKSFMQTKKVKFAGHSPSGNSGLKDNISFPRSRERRLFLLSPANANGIRGNFLLGQCGQSLLWHQLREGTASLGEVFSFISGLYFRGKLTYARTFADPPECIPGILVITAAGGLISPDRLIRLDELREITAGRVDAGESRYRFPLERDAQLLRDSIGPQCEVVLLGSIASPKYIDPLLGIFGERLMFPAEFIGRGDMSRGGLLLRCVRELTQLAYVPVASAERHGVRPPKLGLYGCKP